MLRFLMFLGSLRLNINVELHVSKKHIKKKQRHFQAKLLRRRPQWRRNAGMQNKISG